MTLKLYFLTLLSFLGIDVVWLGLVAPKFYRSQIGHLMAEKGHPAVVCWTLLSPLQWCVGVDAAHPASGLGG